MTFEWDDAKANSNYVKHGIRFEEALYAFYDPWAIYISDPDHSHEELREKIIGICERGLIVIVFTQRGDVIRLITARHATRRERMDYAKKREF